MALNLSTLTSPATSGDVLAEALTTADFLEGVPVLRNLARGSQKGGDAKQDVALNQPKALPLDANGKGYLYLSGVIGNYASVPDAANLNGITDFVMEAKDVYMSDWTTGNAAFFSKYISGNSAFIFRRQSTNINIYALYGGVSSNSSFAHGLTGAATASIRITRLGTSLTAELDTGSGYVAIGSTRTVPAAALDTTTNPLEIGSSFSGAGDRLLGKMSRARMWDNATMAGDPVLDVDFTATNIRHGDTKFKCGSGQVVTINQSGNDPATIIKKPVLRFDGTNDTLGGLFNQTLDGGYMFAAFSVLGDGGIAYGRIFSTNKTTLADTDSSGFIWALRNNLANNLHYWSQNFFPPHAGFFDADRGDYIYELKNTNGSQKSKVNDADLKTSSISTSLELQEFNIGAQHQGGARYTSIDLEYLALFPATITDAQADSVRNYINNRNNVFSLVDGFGYYFYDAQKAPVGAISSGSSSWNGRIVGSDNGDTDRYLTQGTSNDSPVGDGFKVTFADNTDHLDIPSITQAGWQIVGTSLGTFTYRVNANAVTELNLLGNLSHVSFRKTGDLYGIILLPESATGADIEAARKLLIDRGAADGTTPTSLLSFWRNRFDIVEFYHVNTSSVTSPMRAWRNCSALTSFPLLDFNNAVGFQEAFKDCNSLQSFPAIQAPLCGNFSSTWHSCSALTSFPASAQLGTSASNVNFSSAWQSSGLTSFSTPLPTATNLGAAFRYCTPLVSFTLDELPLVTSVSTTWQSTRFQSFSTKLPKVTNCYAAWYYNNALTDFSADVFANWNPSNIQNGVFNLTWTGCGGLTAQSVENILTSIDSSGQYATSTGASGGTALADAGIDIDYNTATGTPAYSTLASLKAKGWSIIVNNVTL